MQVYGIDLSKEKFDLNFFETALFLSSSPKLILLVPAVKLPATTIMMAINVSAESLSVMNCKKIGFIAGSEYESLLDEY
ncbi:hypothetical protein [Sphingobacterium thalpophilum]|uniref:hypothetical protein n=1 Tax=Sphingobacterium thalpophilum TaxID=259 RepID=UPI0024A7833C|nr:hypothetical protein [Sphingobacterium thalpophilum]